MPKATAVKQCMAEPPPPMLEASNDCGTNEEEEEPSEQCRVCTIRSDCFSYYNIYEKLIFKNVGVAEALAMVTSLEIRSDDELPKTICCRCEQRLLDAYHFRKLAESSARGFNRALAKRPSTGGADTAEAALAAGPGPKAAAVASKPTPTTKAKPATAAPVAVRQPPHRPAVTAKPSKSAKAVAAAAANPKVDAAAVVIGHEHLEHSATNKSDWDNAEDASAEGGDSMKLEMGEDKDSFKIVYLDELKLQRVVPVKLHRSPRMTSKNAFEQLNVLNKYAKPELDGSYEIDEMAEEHEAEEEVQLDEVVEDVDGDDDGVSFLIRSVEPSSEITPEQTSAEIPPKPRPLKRPASSSPSRPTNTETTYANSPGADNTASDAIQRKRRVNNTRTPEEHSEEYLRRKHKCEVCGKRFIGRSNLVDHLRHHANVKPFKCDLCDKAFVQKGSLVCHMRTHTQERPFDCDVCGKTFSQASSRQIHMRLHTQERNYVCPLCEKAFYSNSDLSKHKRTHDAVMAYQCPHCSSGFAQRPNLKKHVLKKHPDQEWHVPAS